MLRPVVFLQRRNDGNCVLNACYEETTAMKAIKVQVPFSLGRYYGARHWCAECITTGWEFGGFLSAVQMEFVFQSEFDGVRFKQVWDQPLDETEISAAPAVVAQQ